MFLTGQDEIDSAARLLEEKAAQITEAAAGGAHSLVVQPIYAALPPEQQMKVGGGQCGGGSRGGGGRGKGAGLQSWVVR